MNKTCEGVNFMKIKILFFITIIGLLFACSTSPYLKETELPENTQYYSVDKQFKVKPEWYWRVRPGNFIDLKELINKTGDGIIIGETIQNSLKFYIVKWRSYGYYFIQENDYLFAMKYKKYLIPLQYYDESLFKDPFKYRAFTNPIELLSNKINNKDELNYEWNLTNLMTIYLQKFKITYFFEIAYFFELLNSTGSISRDIFKNDIQSQIISHGSYSNTFLLIPANKVFYEFISNPAINLYNTRFSSSFFKTTMYTNDYGIVLNGNLYRVNYIIAQWGRYYYAFPASLNNKE